MYQFYTTANGLLSSEILSLEKDKQGFLWIGTPAGLSRYDGYQFINYTYSSNSEFIGRINKIVATADNNLWIGSGSGLFLYRNNELVKAAGRLQAGQGVNDILVKNDGSLWLATEKGPAFIPAKDLKPANHVQLDVEKYILPQWPYRDNDRFESSVLIVSEAVDGTVYFAQTNSVFRYSEKKIELVYTHPDKFDVIQNLFAVSRSKFYFDASSSEINTVENGIARAKSVKEFFNPQVLPSDKGIWYAGTRGVFKFHPETGTASEFINLLKDDIIWPSAVVKEENFIWAGSHDGLILIKPKLFYNYNLISINVHTDYYSCAVLADGKVAIGSNRGKVLKQDLNGFSMYKDNLVPKAEIMALHQDARNWLWAASGYQGIVVTHNGRLQRYTTENGLHNNTFSSFLETRAGKLLAVGEGGLTEITVDEQQKVHFRKYIHLPASSQKANFFSAVEGPDGTVWVGGDEGLFYIEGDKLRQHDIDKKTFAINSLVMDSVGQLWIAAIGEGILQCRFNRLHKPEVMKRLSIDDGLQTMNYLTLMTGRDGNVWAGSSTGISFIGIAGKYAGRVINFDETDGFIKPGYSRIRMCQQSNGNITAVTTNGVVAFSEMITTLHSPQPAVFITSVQQKNGSYLTPHGSSERAVFPYYNNSFRFNFTALDYAGQKNVRYFYKLEGLDTGWKSTGSPYEINFQNLSPGKYSLQIKAISSKGVWSDENAVYAFTISPPFWKTGWFITLISLLFLAALYLLVKRREQLIKKREAEKTELLKLKNISYQRQLETEQIISYFTNTINEGSDAENLLWDVSKKCIAKLGLIDCVIYMADHERKMLVQKAAWGPKIMEENRLMNPIEIPFGKGIVGHVAVSGIAEIVSDTSIDSRYIVDDERRLSEIAVPVIYNGQVTGVIDSEHPEKNFYTDHHLYLLSTIASLLANRLAKIDAEQLVWKKETEVLRLKASQYQYQLETEQVINYFATAISVQNNVDDLLWDISKNLIGKLGFEDGMIYLWNSDKTMLVQKAGYGIKGAMQIEADKNKYHVPKGKGIVGAAADTRQTILVNDTSKDSRYFTADGKIRLSELCVPIIYDNEVLGVINTEHSEGNFYTQRHVQILNSIAAHCADKIKRIAAEQQARGKEVEVLKLNQNLAESQLTALRSQMNPHFIFNALNSVQQYILKGNTDEANRYLSKFSRLQREILNNSNQPFITLEKEKEILELYLQLEQLRFNENFSYHILIDEEMDTTEIKLPPMLLQPFVENAIWHGLMPKQGERRVEIEFILKDKILHCFISDNGIGREAAARLKETFNAVHPSKGMSIVNERLKILRQQYQQPFEAEVTDIAGPANKVAGTRVALKIYVGHGW